MYALPIGFKHESSKCSVPAIAYFKEPRYSVLCTEQPANQHAASSKLRAAAGPLCFDATFVFTLVWCCELMLN
jgi:hypothetical protein